MLRSALMLVGVFVTLGISSSACASSAESHVIQAHDRLYLYGRIIGCGGLLSPVDYGKVTESGEVTLRGITLPALGREPAEVASALADEIGARAGSRPESLKIFAVRAEDYAARARLSLLMARDLGNGCTPDRLPADPFDRIKPLYDVPDELPDYRIAHER